MGSDRVSGSRYSGPGTIPAPSTPHTVPQSPIRHSGEDHHPQFLTSTPQITSLGGLTRILISHPHFYTTWADWSTTFHCPVYLAKRDADRWANRTSTPHTSLRLLTQTHTEILAGAGATAIICGGHFDASMVLHWEGRLMVSDTVFTVAACPHLPFVTPSPPFPQSQKTTN